MVVAKSILHSWHDARDAVQDAFVAAFVQLKRLWSPHKFGAWFIPDCPTRRLYGIVAAESRAQGNLFIWPWSLSMNRPSTKRCPVRWRR